MVSCSGDVTNAGESILTEEDFIIVGCDTFATHSSITQAHAIYSTPDSFLLGECDSRFGTIHADILAQFTCPVGFEYPEGSVVDSVCLFFYYTSWHGDGNTPMSLSIYEVDKQSLSYASAYSHDINVEDYCTIDPSNMVLARQRVLSAATPTDSVYNSSIRRYIPYVRMRLTDDFAQRFFAKKDFSSLQNYTKDFKGLYLQSDFGSATLLHVSNINMAVYYHFSYSKQGVDTVVSDVKGFYANNEVRQVNRYIYLNEDIESLKADSNSVNYIVSPANLYTRISLPVREMSQSIIDSIGNKRPYINKAELALEVLNVYDGTGKETYNDWAQPSVNMLLIKESAVDRFFSNNELPSDTCAILGTLSSYSDGNDSTRYFYTYDIADLLTKTIRSIEANDTTIEDNLNMLLVPVSVATTTSSSSYYSSGTTSISAVKHEQTVTATVIRSAQNAEKPLSLEVVYSGF